MLSKPFAIQAALVCFYSPQKEPVHADGISFTDIERLLHVYHIPTVVLKASDRPEDIRINIGSVIPKTETEAESTLFIGNRVSDIRLAASAGMITVCCMSGSGLSEGPAEFDFPVNRLEDLSHILRMGRPMPIGKFPQDLLEKYLTDFCFHDESVIIHPGIGEDTAAVDVRNTEVLILKSDPITFATDSIGYYTVLVNANDIATSGATPRWLLTTLLFPPHYTPSQAFGILLDLRDACNRWGITLCGGHTEITDSVTRPVVIGMMAGTVSRKRLLDKRDIREGDLLWITKALAVEGNSIIAREFGGRLKESGFSVPEIDGLKEFLDRIGILKEARIAAEIPGIVAMHDVTEGGLAAAVSELSVAGGHRIRIRMESIPVYPETHRVCRIFGIDPLGLIASGSLLICTRPESGDVLRENMDQSHIPLTWIGEILGTGTGVEAIRDGFPCRWPKFDTDEITRIQN
jgi:hydrogenase maturation factor